LDACLSPQILGHLSITGSLMRQSPDGVQRTGAMKVLQDRLKARDSIGLAELLLATMDCEATNPRDKVYALYGMVTANSAFPEAMIPDYKKPVHEIYVETAKYLLLDDYLFWVLPQAGVGHPRSFQSPYLPSWVPDWSSPLRGRPLTITYSGLHKYSASGSSSQSRPLRSKDGTLILQGIPIQHSSPRQYRHATPQSLTPRRKTYLSPGKSYTN
jgi:hypothetical protein